MGGGAAILPMIKEVCSCGASFEIDIGLRGEGTLAFLGTHERFTELTALRTWEREHAYACKIMYEQIAPRLALIKEHQATRDNERTVRIEKARKKRLEKAQVA